MNRHLLKNFTGKIISKPAAICEATGNSEELIKLSREMKNYLAEAAKDLLQPRPEAVAQLLKKCLVQ